MNQAVVIGISNYPNPAHRLPAVAADVREIGKLLASRRGAFQGSDVTVLSDAKATRTTILKALAHAFTAAGPNDTVFVYLAGHGSVGSDSAYYFFSYNADLAQLTGTAVPLPEIKRLFDECKSRRVFLWLDFCHSGGILRRTTGASPPSDTQAIERTLKVVQGEGKFILAACTPEQSAYEDAALGHGHFTAYLLKGLQGEAASGGEITANSLYDYIDRQMGSGSQRPMMFGHLTGRVVLMHVGSQAAKARPTAATAKSPKQPASKKVVVESSGDWCLLGEEFFHTRAVRRHKDGRLMVEVPSASAALDAALTRLRPDRFMASARLPFAYLNDSTFVRVEHVESAAAGGKQVWTITLQPEDMRYSGGGLGDISYSTSTRLYSADDIAKARASRILLNDPPPLPLERRTFPTDTLPESFFGGGSATPLRCPIQTVYANHRDSKDFLQLARLACIFQLKSTGTVAEVLHLALGPVFDDRVHVHFKGRRARIALNTAPMTIELEGDCSLR